MSLVYIPTSSKYASLADFTKLKSQVNLLNNDVNTVENSLTPLTSKITISGNNITIGTATDTTSLQGTLNVINTTNFEVKDAIITLNKGNAVNSSGLASLQFADGTTDNANYIRVNTNRTGFELKAKDLATTINLNQSLLNTDTPTFSGINFPSSENRKRLTLFPISSDPTNDYYAIGITNSTMNFTLDKNTTSKFSFDYYTGTVGSYGTAATLTRSGNLSITGGLSVNGQTITVGKSGANGTTELNGIYIRGTTGDLGDTSSGLIRRVYNGTEKSEVILFNFNDINDGLNGPDRIKLLGAELTFFTYNVATTDIGGGAERMTIKSDGNITMSNNLTVYNTTASGSYNFNNPQLITGTPVNLSSYSPYTIIINTSASTLNLPNAPSVGTVITIFNSTALTTHTVSRSGTTDVIRQEGTATTTTSITIPAYKQIKLMYLDTNLWQIIP